MIIDDFLTYLVAEKGYDSIDEYLDRKPYVARPERHMQFSIACTQCQWKDSQSYGRQNPDRLLLSQWCPNCHSDLRLVDAIPNTTFYQSHSMKHASFSDDTSGECWQCGHKRNLQPYTFTNGTQVEVCTRHLKPWQKRLYQARLHYAATVEQERAARANERFRYSEEP